MNRIFSWFCKIFLKPIVDILFIKKVKGLENIPKGNFILATNHQSHLDVMVCAYLCVPKRFTYLGQVDRYTGWQGLIRDFIYFLGGVIPVNREDKASKKKAILRAIETLKKGDIVVIFPEGTRSRTGKIQEGKTGVAKIFLRSGVPILPAGIKGTFELLPPGRGFPKIKKIIEVNVGKPFYFEEEFQKARNLSCDSKEYQDICQKITNEIMEEIKKLIECI